MTDNLSIKGIREDEFPQGARRLKPHGKRKKPWVIEYRLPRRVTTGFALMMRLSNWAVHSRYTTCARRDQAYAMLVKKPPTPLGWEYRKRDD